MPASGRKSLRRAHPVARDVKTKDKTLGPDPSKFNSADRNSRNPGNGELLSGLHGTDTSEV
jgi:hypothetical protein